MQSMAIYQSRCRSLVSDGLTLSELNEYRNFQEVMSLYEFKQVMLEKQKRKNKRYRTKQKYIELIKIRNCLKIKSNIVFGTITLNNHYLNLKENTYIKNIHKWLKSHFIYAILNKDYGSKTEREHYHFIGLTTEHLIDTKINSRKGNRLYKLEKQDYKMGHEPTLEVIVLSENDMANTINYLLKLNNHSSKIGTKSRVRVLKSTQANRIIFLNGIEATKAEKEAKKKVIIFD